MAFTTKLHAKVIYGLKTNIDGNAHFITDNDILYPVGNVLVVHNFSQHRQGFLHLSDKQHINIIHVAPNKKFVALCETGEKPLISIYDLHSLRRKKTLGIPYDAPGVTKFSCISFSFDNRYLAAITDGLEQIMLFYAWEKGKVESSIRLETNQYSSYFMLSCNPADVGIVAVAGNFAFKFLTVSETVWRPYGFAKADNLLFSSICWLNMERLLAGIKDGRIFYFENGELKNIFKMESTMQMNLKIREDFVIQPTVSQTKLNGQNGKMEIKWDQEIQCLTAFPNGFAFGYGLRRIVVFEKDGQHKYVKRHNLVIPTQVSQVPRPDLYKINFINISPSFDRLLVTCLWSQLFTTKLFDSGPETGPEPIELEILGQALHHGPIGRISMCAWKSVFMTFGSSDRSVRLWDYNMGNLVMMKQYSEDVFSVSLHPIGLFCLIGFSDKLRFLTILIDDLLPIAEFSIRNCRIVDFSNGGHLFAAVNGNVIQVFSTIGFANRLLLKGHVGTIKGLDWDQSDLKLVTIGSEGAIYVWSIVDGTRMSEIILKDVQINGVKFTPQESTIYCVSSDKKFRVIKENSIVNEFEALDIEMSDLLISQHRESFFILITSPHGKIGCLKNPLQEPLEYQTFPLHSDDITDFAISFNQQIVITAAQDGSLAFWKVFNNSIDPSIFKYINTEEILIGQADLEDKIRSIEELNMRLKELETEHSYKARQIEVQNSEKMRDVHRGYCEAIEELKDRIEQIQESKMNEFNNINLEIVNMKAAHEKIVQEMEISYNSKLIKEYENHAALQKKTSEMRAFYEDELKKLRDTVGHELEKTAYMFKDDLHKKNGVIEELQETMTYLVKEHEKIKLDIEKDVDREVAELRSSYEEQLFNERKDNLKFKGEAGMMRNRYEAAQKDINDYKRQVVNLRKDHQRYQRNIQLLERQIVDLKNIIDERNEVIQEKDKKVNSIENKNQELEKVRLVLNYRIEELKNEIAPKDSEIDELKIKIQDIEVELVNQYKMNSSLNVKLIDLKDKLGGIRKELENQVKKERKTQMIIKKIGNDLAAAVEVIQQPNVLKNAVKNLYHNYGSYTQDNRQSDVDLQCEFLKQRDQLERTVASLKRQVYQKQY